MKVTFYKLEKVTVNLTIATAAIWNCSLCGNCIEGMGGPGNGTICVACGDALMAGRPPDNLEGGQK